MYMKYVDGKVTFFKSSKVLINHRAIVTLVIKIALYITSLRSFKDFRRRSVEAVLVTVGASEKTVDADFEILHTKFEHLCITMNSCKIFWNKFATYK